MPRGVARAPGFKALTIPERTNDMQPEMRDADASRGPLAHVPREPIYRVQDFGAPTTASGSTGSPARGDFTSAGPTLRARKKVTRQTEENQTTRPSKNPAITDV